MAYAFGASSESIIHEVMFLTTTAWTPSFDCRAIVTTIGAGGSGGAVDGTNTSTAYCAAGGGAGGVAKSLLTLVSGTSYTATIGAGGAYATGNAAGSIGGNSTFGETGETVLMTANYGSGGAYDTNGGVSSATGGAGGAASGGNIFNATGGAGGNATVPYWGGGYHVSIGGGGAAGIFGLGHRGGHGQCQDSTNYGYNKTAAGAGAGVWGEGGDAWNTRGTNTYVNAMGGSAWGKGYSPAQASSFDPITDGVDWRPNMYNYDFKPRGLYPLSQVHDDKLTDAGQTMQGQSVSIFDGLVGGPAMRTLHDYYSNAGPGAGGNGQKADSPPYQSGFAMPGLFGGGGGQANYSGSGSTYGAAGSFGAGGGGCAAVTNGDSYSGMGGGGLVVISIVEMF